MKVKRLLVEYCGMKMFFTIEIRGSKADKVLIKYKGNAVKANRTRTPIPIRVRMSVVKMGAVTIRDLDPDWNLSVCNGNSVCLL